MRAGDIYEPDGWLEDYAFEEGVKAWKMGIKECPYTQYGSPTKHNQWVSGWVHMEECSKVSETQKEDGRSSFEEQRGDWYGF